MRKAAQQNQVTEKVYQIFCSFDTSEYKIGRLDACDCACGNTLVQKSIRNFSEAKFCIPSKLGHIAVTKEFNIVFAPSTSQFVVVNSSTDDLIGVFSQPRSMDFVKSLKYDEEILTLVKAGILISEKPVLTSEQGDEFVAWLHVINECNLRCSYCYLNKTNDVMTPEIGIASIDAICRSARSHNFRRIKLKFAGGEPTLVMPLVLQLSEYAQTLTAQSGLELQAVVLSNGTSLREDMIESLLQRKIALMVSLDALTSAHNAQRPFANGQPSLDAVISGIERSITMGLLPEISITITDKNISSLSSLLEWILAHKLRFHLNFCREQTPSGCDTNLKKRDETIIAGMLKAYNTIAKQLPDRSLLGCLLDHTNLFVPHQYPCGVGQNYLVIDHKGRVAKCQMEITSSITTVWDPDPLETVRQDKVGLQNPSVEEREECQNCEWRYWCAGGCPLETYRATGRHDLKSPKCHIYKQLLPEVIRCEGHRILTQAAII